MHTMKRVLFLLAQMSDLDIEWLIRNGERLDIAEGDTLIHRNQPLHFFYIVLSGRLSVKISDNDFEDIASIGVGEVLGEMSLIEARHPSVTVRAATNCEVYAIPMDLITERIHSDIYFKANLYYALALFLSDRLRKTTYQLGYGISEAAAH